MGSFLVSFVEERSPLSFVTVKPLAVVDILESQPPLVLGHRGVHACGVHESNITPMQCPLLAGWQIYDCMPSVRRGRRFGGDSRGRGPLPEIRLGGRPTFSTLLFPSRGVFIQLNLKEGPPSFGCQSWKRRRECRSWNSPTFPIPFPKSSLYFGHVGELNAPAGTFPRVGEN